MIAYMIRRLLYAIPILLGVNVIVFALFFVVTTPDQIAERQLGERRATPDRIDQYKREHNLDLPYFYNSGWNSLGSIEGQEVNGKIQIKIGGPGNYRLIVDTPQNEKFAQKRTIELSTNHTEPVTLDTPFKEGRLELPAEIGREIFNFEIDQTDQTWDDPSLTLNFKLEQPSRLHRVKLEYQSPLPFFERFTRTLFFQKSLKMLWFDYGKSNTGNFIRDEILERIGPSISITVPAFFTGLVFSVFIAMLVAFFRATYVDYWAVLLCVLGMSISLMFYIIGGQFIFGKMLKLTPISGFDYGLSSLKFILLPVLISLLGGLGESVRFYRTIFLEEINRDYVRTARSKGLSERSVLFIHTLKNASLPILTGVVVSLPFLMTGGIVMESFFAIPGMGAYLLNAIQSQDFSIVQAMVSLGSYLFIIALVMTDISYTLVDPRVRLG